MSTPEGIESAARHVEPTVGWDALQRPLGMPMEEVMAEEEALEGRCEHCGVDLAKEIHGLKSETVAKLFLFFFADGNPVAWELVARRVYAFAKHFYPHLLMMRGLEGEAIPMSLERLGHVFDEPNTPAARARWEARIDRILTDLLRRGGSQVKAPHQKSAEACAKMSQAAKRTKNRRKKEPSAE